jgi:hypothetical protein
MTTNESFSKDLKTAVAKTPFSVDMLAAIAQQETGYMWGPFVARRLSVKKILALCVGDTFDFPSCTALTFYPAGRLRGLPDSRCRASSAGTPINAPCDQASS